MSTPDTPSLLFITTRAPWQSAAPGACLDMLLTAGVFGQSVSIAFLGDAVWQLYRGQDGTQLQQKTLANALPALELYDIRQVYVEAEALQSRHIAPSDLLVPVELLDTVALRSLLAGHDRSLVF